MWRRKSFAILILVIPMVLPLSLKAQEKPFTQEQITKLVQAGLGDDSGSKLIEQRGIDFAPSDDFIQTLKTAGASEAFLSALRAAKPPEPASAKKPINQVQVFALLVGQVPSHRVAMLVQERGIDFEPTDDYLQEVRVAGGEDELISALRSAKVTKPATIDPAAQARQAEVRQHAARGAEFFQKRQYEQAEQELRDALLLDSQDPDLYISLSAILGEENKWDDCAAAAREAIRLSPNHDEAHVNLGYALSHNGDQDGAIAEYHEGLRLNPNNDLAHANLGVALALNGDYYAAIAEYGEALRLNPNDGTTHGYLGLALANSGKLDGAIVEFREALRLNPSDEEPHVNLGVALGKKGDWDGAISEYHEALRLNPNNGHAHFNLSTALGAKGDWDGVLAESREVLRMNPDNSSAHFGLGLALEEKGDRHGALEEYRAAYMLDPKNAQFKQAYESLLQQVNR